jgi:FixJ family two-component response regulator
LKYSRFRETATGDRVRSGAEIYLRAQRLLNIATPGEYRALVADTSLRGTTDGWEVAQRASEIDPNFPVVYISGASASAGVWRQKVPQRH